MANNSRRKFFVLVALAGILSGTSLLLLTLAPAPLSPNAWSVLSAVEGPKSLDPIIHTRTRIQPGRWHYIYIHHSRTASGDSVSLSLPGDGLPDHFLIGNGEGCPDGEIQIGQRWNQQLSALPPAGASSIDPRCVSICLVGDLGLTKPTAVQMRRLTQLVNYLQDHLRIPPGNVLIINQDIAAGAGRFFPVDEFRQRLLP